MSASWIRYGLLLSSLVACGDDDRPLPVDPPPLEREQAGGNPSAVVIDGTRAYVAVGPRLTIWNTASGTLLGETPPLRGVIQAVAVAGGRDRAYVAERIDLDSRVHVIDISDPAAPAETAELDLATAGFSVILDLEATEDRLYVADQEQGVIELDLADPDAPSVVRTAPAFGVSGLALAGPRLYFTATGFIGGLTAGALDTTNALAELGASGFGHLAGATVTAEGLLVGAGPDGIFVYDLTDPADPIEQFSVGEPEQGPFARAVAAAGSFAYVPAHDGLHVLDLSSPTAIEHTGPIALPTAGVNDAAAASGTLAIVTDRGRMLLLDLTEPAAPVQRTAIDVSLCADCVGVAATDETLYLADIVGGLRTGSLGDLAMRGRSPELPAQPNGLQFVFEGVEVVDGHAYVADWLYGIRIYDVSNPAAIAELGSLATGGAPDAVAVADGRAYLVEGTGGGALHVLDVADPEQPALLGSTQTSKAVDVVIAGDLAYVADEELFGTGGLKIYDVADPAAIRLLGTYNTGCANARGVAVLGELAIVACSSDGFHLVDVAAPAQPRRVAVIPAPGISTAWSVAAWEGHAVLGHDHGVMVASLATPSAPRVIARHATASTVRALAVPVPGRVVAAAGLAGVYQWQVE
jgi:hypothetical protein